MKKQEIVLVAHSYRDDCIHSVDNVRIITQAHREMTFEEAKRYFNGEKKPEYASVAVGLCSPLSDCDYQNLFDVTTVPDECKGPYVFTGKYVANDLCGKKIYALRRDPVSLNEISKWAEVNSFIVILVACRND